MGNPETSTRPFYNSIDQLSQMLELIVWNDDVNTFDWVIESLMEVCHHTHEQATQCAYLIHFKGKYAVKKGSYELLHPMKEALIDRGIQATLNTCGEEV